MCMKPACLKLKSNSMKTCSFDMNRIWWQAHYEELKAERDMAEQQLSETTRQLSRAEKQLKESQQALSNSTHEVTSSLA